MKKLFFFLFASVIFCVSCKQSQKHTFLIPAKSAVIAAFDMPSIIKKAQFENIDTLESEELLNEFPVLREFMKNPTNTGIDFTSDLFVFYVMHNENDYVCATIPLKNQKQTQDFIENSLSKAFTAEGKQRFYAIEYETWIALENNQLLVVSHDYGTNKEVSAEFMNYLVNLPKEEAIAENENFKTFCKDKNDIGIFVASTPLLNKLDNAGFSELLTEQLNTMKLSEADLRDNYFIVDVDFANKAVEINCTWIANEQFENYLLANNISKERLSNELLQFAHATSMFALFYSVDTDKLLAYLHDMHDMPELAELNKVFLEATGFSIDKIISLFAGEFLFSLYDVQNTNALLVAVASVANETEINTVLQTKFADCQKNAAIPYYDLSNFGMGKLLVAVHNNTIMLTTDSTALAVLINGGFENTLSNKDFASSTDDDVSMFMNLDFSTYPEVVKKSLNLYNKDFIESVPFKSLVASSDNLSGKIIVNMKKSNDNSLAQIIQFVQLLANL